MVYSMRHSINYLRIYREKGMSSFIFIAYYMMKGGEGPKWHLTIDDQRVGILTAHLKGGSESQPLVAEFRGPKMFPFSSLEVFGLLSFFVFQSTVLSASLSLPHHLQTRTRLIPVSSFMDQPCDRTWNKGC